ncbi:hypothetical protein Tco_1450750 [Tanacetum coccineum]
MWTPLPQRVSFSPEIDTYRAKFKIEFPNKDLKEEFPGWFGKQIRQRHVDNDPCVNESSELFALACGPSQTPISVNSCVVNGVRFVVYSRDERRTTQNSGICSPGPDGEMYYGQLEQILEFSYLLFKTVLFREEKIKDSKILIDELDPPGSSDFLPFPECDSVFYEDFSKVDALPSTNNEDKDCPGFLKPRARGFCPSFIQASHPQLRFRNPLSKSYRLTFIFKHT